MKFNTIRIEGSILSADILDKIEQGELGGQLVKDFAFAPHIKVKDEIARAWADAQDLWHIFSRHRGDVPPSASGASETRRFWILPFLNLLGYDLEISKAEMVNDKSYAISHRSKNLDNFPVHIMGFNDSLDRKRTDSGPRMSPHALVQEYINLTEHLYAIVTNGIHLRILRDSSRLVKLSFIEFDLQAMMEEGHYADFAVMFRLLHASRMPKKMDDASESLIEKYHQDALDSGSRIRDGLREAVMTSIESLANGLLNHPENDRLRKECDDNTLSPDSYYQYLLRLIYRLLFLMVVEERHLIFTPSSDRRKRDIYYNFYSIARLRKLCEKPAAEEDRYDDLWQGLKNTFRLFESDAKGSHLEIKPLAGDLFGHGSLDMLTACRLDNQTLLCALKNLSVFTHRATGQKMRVNYASLNVEEFGSVYEGLLEFSPVIVKENGAYRFWFAKGSERSATGSHYTPDELVHPLISHSLDHIIEERLKSADPEKALLAIRVCDAGAGSGHILLNAARRIGAELAKFRTGEDQPSPSAYREGVRDAVRHCIYGVDKNPLAVELCKVSLWLEAHVPGEPLNFMDHHIKCGDSLVGVARREELLSGMPAEAFKSLPGDDPEVAGRFAKKNAAELKEKERGLERIDFEGTLSGDLDNIADLFKKLDAMPETTPAEIEAKQKAYQNLTGGDRWWRLKTLADIRTAQFFIPKTKVNEQRLITDEPYRGYLKGGTAKGAAPAKAVSVSSDYRFFHWFLEFPEIFSSGGFDCTIGNPPFLGGQKLSGTFGQNYLEYLKSAYAPAGSCDLVTYFFRRNFTIIKHGGFQALISTNTIAQGGSREGGLEVIINQGGSINFAVRSMKWPGLAAVEVSLVNIYKGKWQGRFVLGSRQVNYISAYLDDAETIGNPFPLKQNENKSFQGSIVLGKGFILTPDAAERLIAKNPKNREVLFPYLNGDDLNSNPDQSPSRWVINFFDWTEEKCRKEYPDCFEIVERLVKPERMKQKGDRGAEYWWQFLRMRGELYRTIAPLERVLVISRVSKYLICSPAVPSFVFADQTFVVADYTYSILSTLQSNIHDSWVWKMCSTMGSGLRYTATSAFETFPFPQNLSASAEAALEEIGRQYYEHRRKLMLMMQLGLTKTYNQFHNPRLTPDIDDTLDKQAFEKKHGKETLFLWNHLNRTENTCTFAEAAAGILELRTLHRQMDETVLSAYGWSDIPLNHDFYEVDYLPENDRIRYTISPDARKEILKRLLQLNHDIHKKEQTQSPLPKKKSKSKIILPKGQQKLEF